MASGDDLAVIIIICTWIIVHKLNKNTRILRNLELEVKCGRAEFLRHQEIGRFERGLNQREPATDQDIQVDLDALARSIRN